MKVRARGFVLSFRMKHVNEAVNETVRRPRVGSSPYGGKTLRNNPSCKLHQRLRLKHGNGVTHNQDVSVTRAWAHPDLYAFALVEIEQAHTRKRSLSHPASQN